MDLWVNDYEDINGNKAKTLEDLLHSQWEYLNMGSEAEVYAYDDTMVLKSINLSHVNDNPSKLLTYGSNCVVRPIDSPCVH